MLFSVHLRLFFFSFILHFLHFPGPLFIANSFPNQSNNSILPSTLQYFSLPISLVTSASISLSISLFLPSPLCFQLNVSVPSIHLSSFPPSSWHSSPALHFNIYPLLSRFPSSSSLRFTHLYISIHRHYARPLLFSQVLWQYIDCQAKHFSSQLAQKLLLTTFYSVQ